jgi:hypothetical protein
MAASIGVPRPVLLALFLLVPLPAHADTRPTSEDAKARFLRDIAPILRGRCLRCHGPAKARAGLRLDTRANLLKGSDSGPVVRPGAAARSRLAHVVAGTASDGLVMPPRGPRLSAAETGRIRAWINRGAPWPEGLALEPDAAKEPTHWAFRPIRNPRPPAVRHLSRIRNPIDAFVLARLEAEGIPPAPPADRRTLIRRVTLDLIGLPPTPEEIDAFVADRSPDAYEKVVDRLLASPAYGERWARHWLDLCHYADTDGYLTDQARPVAWRYRQWLIRALNDDLPFAPFTVRQLAGDLLPDAGIEEKLATGFLRNTLSNREGGADLEEFRVEQVIDRTRMVGTLWLGLTVGCARCHDHKFDSLTQREFYRLYAFLDPADEVNIDAPLPGELGPYLKAKPEYDRKRAALIAPVAKDLADLQARWEEKLRRAREHPGEDHVWDRKWEVLGLIWGGGLGEGQLEGTQVVLTDPAKRTQDQKDRLLDYFLKRGEVIDPARFKELKLAQLAKKLDELKKTLPPLTRAPAMRSSPVPRKAYIHTRGDFRRKGPTVTPGTPAFLPPFPGDTPRDRLGLARWLLGPENPLTDRVEVNRAWQGFFGQGLVRTPEDFGTRGDPPTHPDLLDWLASEFRRLGRRRKALHRLIVTSATYRQSSRCGPALRARDPENRLLARQTSLRLSAEQVRDSALAVAGLLCRKVGGPSVFPPQPESVVKESFDNTWTESVGPDRHRRGLYTYLQRLSPYAQGVIFDAPSPGRTCTRRERTNTPLQALTLLNDPVFVEAARALAERVLRKDPDKRIEYAFCLCLGRPPSAREEERLLAYQREQFALLRAEPGSAAKFFPQKVEGIDTADGAAWVGVCSVLLNLHEFITRE